MVSDANEFLMRLNRQPHSLQSFFFPHSVWVFGMFLPWAVVVVGAVRRVLARGTRIASPPSTDNTIIREGECFGSLHSSLSHVHGSIFLIFSLSFLLPLGDAVVADFSHVGSVVAFVVTNFFFAVFVVG